jgi:hypothetical protein
LTSSLFRSEQVKAGGFGELLQRRTSRTTSNQCVGNTPLTTDIERRAAVSAVLRPPFAADVTTGVMKPVDDARTRDGERATARTVITDTFGTRSDQCAATETAAHRASTCGTSIRRS